MKKAARLNQELLYLQDKKVFHLQDLKNKFSISERTALRDIQDLEEIGLALYSSPGRSGSYHLLKNSLALPIRFKTEEINAIFFALQSIKEISTSPYSNNYEQIKEKLLTSLPLKLRRQIIAQQNDIHFYSQPSLKQVPFFKNLLKACLDNQLIEARNTQFVTEKQKLQLLDFFYQTGNWFCHAYNLDLKKWFILRLDKFQDVHPLKEHNLLTKSELQKSFLTYQRQYHYLTYQCLLTSNGESKVHFNHYPDMQILYKDDKIYLQGKFNPEEKNYLVDYFLSLGNDVQVIGPNLLKQAYVAKLKTILGHYN